jgi:hypothetical protein
MTAMGQPGSGQESVRRPRIRHTCHREHSVCRRYRDNGEDQKAQHGMQVSQSIGVVTNLPPGPGIMLSIPVSQGFPAETSRYALRRYQPHQTRHSKLVTVLVIHAAWTPYEMAFLYLLALYHYQPALQQRVPPRRIMELDSSCCRARFCGCDGHGDRTRYTYWAILNELQPLKPSWKPVSLTHGVSKLAERFLAW